VQVYLGERVELFGAKSKDINSSFNYNIAHTEVKIGS
jgi:hypothetical protein